MESFTAHIQQQLHDILNDLEPRIPIEETREKLETLFTELGIRDAAIQERAVKQLKDILQKYQHTLTTSYEQAKHDLFKLVAQLEYPSRQ
jgi:polyhydroxyalkanoate synthesis regulator phasin